jgi:regulator of protease activity HflC (stomatin/prohibitin superfamily)
VRTDREGLMNRIQEDVRSAASRCRSVCIRWYTAWLLAAGRSTRVRRRSMTVLLAEAQQQSDQLRGSGDADRNRILAEAFGQDPGFFAFYRSMQLLSGGGRGRSTGPCPARRIVEVAEELGVRAHHQPGVGAGQLRGSGDADRNRILAEAFGQDPGFFAFYRSMQA